MVIRQRGHHYRPGERCSISGELRQSSQTIRDLVVVTPNSGVWRQREVTLGDAYEPDDACTEAIPLSANNASQRHGFLGSGDVDWVRVELAPGASYALVASEFSGNVLPTFSARANCTGVSFGQAPISFGGEVVLPLTTENGFDPGVYWIKVSNTSPDGNGANSGYKLTLRMTQRARLAILVAGRNATGQYQHVISQTTDLAYQVLLRHGFTRDDIYYLDQQLGRDVDGNGLADDIDAVASVTNTRYAIETWAVSRGGSGHTLWLFMADHGEAESFKVSGDMPWDKISSTDLNQWLTSFEAATGPGQVNVIIDACYSGSFIKLPESLSKPGRVIATSTSDVLLAYGREADAGITQRMLFSEAFWSALNADLSIMQAFSIGVQATPKMPYRYQMPWLDDNGDGAPNSVADGLIADQRVLGGPVTFGSQPIVTWRGVSLTGALSVDIYGGSIARTLIEVARPDGREVVSPGGQIALTQVDTLTLDLRSGTNWDSYYGGFTTPGRYRLVATAWQVDGMMSAPAAVDFFVYRAHLPLMTK